MKELNLKFEDFYKEYYEKLFIAAFRLTGNKEDAEDVIQETYLNAFKFFRSSGMIVHLVHGFIG